MIDKVYVPPIKIQGIKTKIVPLISEVAWIDKDTTWVEPFMGSGVVGFNLSHLNMLFLRIQIHIQLPYIMQ